MLEVSIKIENLDLFKDIIALLQELAEKDDSINDKMIDIMNRHSTDYEYFKKQ